VLICWPVAVQHDRPTAEWDSPEALNAERADPPGLRPAVAMGMPTNSDGVVVKVGIIAGYGSIVGGHRVLVLEASEEPSAAQTRPDVAVGCVW
jgi:hypothetical protein